MQTVLSTSHIEGTMLGVCGPSKAYSTAGNEAELLITKLVSARAIYAVEPKSYQSVNWEELFCLERLAKV